MVITSPFIRESHRHVVHLELTRCYPNSYLNKAGKNNFFEVTEKLRCTVPFARAYLRLIQRVNPNLSGVSTFLENSEASGMGQCALGTQLLPSDRIFEAQVLSGGSF